MEQDKKGSGLPSNAYKELKPGEEYVPVMVPGKTFPEVNFRSVFWGILLALLFSAAAAYSGLKIGQVMEAAIPISILAVGLSGLSKRKNALGENVIIQSIGASSGVIVAGAILTIPAIFVLELDKKLGVSGGELFLQIFLASMLGGFLGILFLIPFRKYFVKDMHGKFPFPEATATTEILITGESGGKQAGTLAIAGLIGGLYDFFISYFHWWSEVISSRLIDFGKDIADKFKVVVKLDSLSMIVGLGYIVGLKFSTIIVMGSFFSWLVFVPAFQFIASHLAGPEGANIMTQMPAEDIFKKYVRLIGIGGIAMAGIIGIIKSSGIIGSAFKLAVNEIFLKSGDGGEIERTQVDLRMTFIVLFSILSIIAIFFFMLGIVNLSLGHALLALATVVIISFLFTTVAANAIAIVGTNPVSGMTLMTLILSSIVLTAADLKGAGGMLSALIVGGIVCTALSMAGGFITDLKIGYWLGSTPVTQEKWKFLGTIVSAATVGAVILILNSAYGFSSAAENPLPAPQANAMAEVIFPIYSQGEEVFWLLYFAGAVIALILNFLNISPLAFALGMYLPIELNTPLVVGGIISHIVKKSGKTEAISQARSQKGTLIASGFIAGGALFGVFGALLTYLDQQSKESGWTFLMGIFSWLNENVITKAWAGSDGGQILALCMFGLLAAYLLFSSMLAKPNE